MYYVSSGNEDRITHAQRRIYAGITSLAVIATVFLVGNYLLNKVRVVIARNYYDFNNDNE